MVFDHTKVVNGQRENQGFAKRENERKRELGFYKEKKGWEKYMEQGGKKDDEYRFFIEEERERGEWRETKKMGGVSAHMERSERAREKRRWHGKREKGHCWWDGNTRFVFSII